MNNFLLADANDLILRLKWGQPAFTIIDVRDRLTYNQAHITGAISIPLDNLASRALSAVHRERHIYVYGSDDGQTAYAAQLLRVSGFVRVDEIAGGLEAWKTIGGPIDGSAV